MNPNLLYVLLGIGLLFVLDAKAQDAYCTKLGISAKNQSARTVIKKELKQLDTLCYLNPEQALKVCTCLEELSAASNGSALEKAQIQYWVCFLKFYIKPYSVYQELLFADLKNCAAVFQKYNAIESLARTYHLLAQLYSYQIKPDVHQFDWHIDSAEHYVDQAFETIGLIREDPRTKAILKGEVFNEAATLLIRAPKDSALAKFRLDSSLYYFQKAGYKPGIAKAHLNMIYVAPNPDALKHWNKAFEIFTQLGHLHNVAYCQLVLLRHAWEEYEKYHDDDWFFKGEDAFRDFYSQKMRPQILGLAYALRSKLFISKSKKSDDPKYRAHYLELAKKAYEDALSHAKAEGDWYVYDLIVNEVANFCRTYGDCSENLRTISNDYYTAIDQIKKDASLAERKSQEYKQAELAFKSRRKTQWIISAGSFLLLILGVRAYTSKLRNKLLIEKERNASLEAREKERKAVIEASEATRKARLNTHFISNVVNNIQFLIDLQEYAVAKRSLLQFEGYFRSVLSFTENTFVSLDKDKTLSEQYIALAKLGFEDAIQFEGIKVETKKWPIGEVYIPPLLAQPDIENAIKHGILKKPSRKGRLDVSIRPFDEKRLEYQITDDGLGVEKTLKMRSRSQKGLDQKGGKIVEDALSILNKRNLVPEGQEHEHPLGAFRQVISNREGTRVSIVVPYQNSAHGN